MKERRAASAPYGRERGGASPREHMKHQATFTGGAERALWLLHTMTCGEITTLPAAMQPSPAWYATGHRMQRITRPEAGGRGGREGERERRGGKESQREGESGTWESVAREQETER